jgi:hypothetical protein
MLGRLCLDTPRFATEALARGRHVATSVGPEHPVARYGAPRELASVVLGAYQHAPHALRAEALDALALPAVRRASGGAAVWGGQGIVYLALGLLEASTLMACPPGKLLNRNLRGVLAGIRSLGVPAYYFGRDYVAFDKAPGVYAAWQLYGDGRVLLELFAALEVEITLPVELVGYPRTAEGPFRGRAPTTLHALGKTDVTAARLITAIADAFERDYDVHFEPLAPSFAEAAALDLTPAPRIDPRDEGGLTWSSPHEEAIGFVSAGVKLDASGRLAELQLGGDFFQAEACPAQLRERLLGERPESSTLGAALDAVYAERPGLIEGVRSLPTLHAALLEAVERARSLLR